MSVRVAVAGLGLVLLFLSGCASPPQLPVPLGPTAIGAQGARVGVAMTQLPKVDTSFPGADCLLCLAVASMANNALTSHAQALPAEDLPKLKELVAEYLRKRDANVRVIAEQLKIDDLPNASAQGTNIARKDFGTLQKKYEIDKLLVISIASLGFERTYAAYVPTSDPKALVRGVAFMVDLKSNTYDWYQPLNVLRSADGPWDEPTKFPGLTNAYFQAIELGKDEILKPFKP